MRKCAICLLIPLFLASFVRAEVVAKSPPEMYRPGDMVQCEEEGLYIFYPTTVEWDYWMTVPDPDYDGDVTGIARFNQPIEIPIDHQLEFSLDDQWFLRQEIYLTAILGTIARAPVNYRLVLVNPEQAINEGRPEAIESRIWPHLGMLYTGTVADQEGWEVIIHDELVQHYVDLEQLVKPGDVVGFSLLATGMHRGMKLARQAKLLGASYVIAGNDQAAFRANQILNESDKPVDAVFRTDSLGVVREFFQQIGHKPLDHLLIPNWEMARQPLSYDLSNEYRVVKMEQQYSRERRDPQDVFIVPKLDLFCSDYWTTVWKNYRSIFGHKHQCSQQVRNALGLFAHGCTRAAAGNICKHCGINRVDQLSFASLDHLKVLLETYADFGIDYVFNVTDSALEMSRTAENLRQVGAHFPEGMMIYGRAWGLAHHPEYIDNWLRLTGGRLLINCGMESIDERILNRGVDKVSQQGDRVWENYEAVRNVAKSGAHLHMSLIFGSPGETHNSCRRSIEFFHWVRDKLGPKLDQVETDIFWLNHGAPASQVFRDYQYAQKQAALAGKTISPEVWYREFYQNRDTLAVPWSAQRAWYEYFTNITLEDAQRYNQEVFEAMVQHEGAAPGRPDMLRQDFS